MFICSILRTHIKFFFSLHVFFLGVGTALVSTLRKVATVMLSFIVHGRNFNVGYAMGGGMIVAALLVSKLCGKSGGGSSKNATAIKTNEIMKMEKKNSSTETVEEV